MCGDKDELDVSLRSLTAHFSSLEKPVLLVLDCFNSLPLLHTPLKALMLKPNIQIVLTSHKSSLTDRLKEDSDRYLTRGLILHVLKPLHCLSALQRLIYNVLSQHELIPMNKEQNIFDDMEVFVGGQPDLVNITCALVNHCIEEAPSPSEGLARFDDQVIERTKIDVNEALNKEDTQKVAELLTAKHESIGDTIDDNMYTKPAIIYSHVLIEFAQFNHWEHLYLCCLSSLYCMPIHSSVLEALENKLNFYRENKEAEKMDLISHLKAFKFITSYPHPVISSSLQKNDEPPISTYFTIPPIICETVQLYLTEQDKFISCSLLYHTLNELSSSLNNTSVSSSSNNETHNVPSFIVLHCIALRGALLQVIAQEEELFGKDVLADVMDKYITEKCNIQGKESLAEIILEIS